VVFRFSHTSTFELIPSCHGYRSLGDNWCRIRSFPCRSATVVAGSASTVKSPQLAGNSWWRNGPFPWVRPQTDAKPGRADQIDRLPIPRLRRKCRDLSDRRPSDRFHGRRLTVAVTIRIRPDEGSPLRSPPPSTSRRTVARLISDRALGLTAADHPRGHPFSPLQYAYSDIFVSAKDI